MAGWVRGVGPLASISLPVLLTGCGIVVPSDPARECVPPFPLHPGLAAPEHKAFGCSKVPSSFSCCCTLTIVQRVVPNSSIAKLPLLKALWVWPQASQDFTTFLPPQVQQQGDCSSLKLWQKGSQGSSAHRQQPLICSRVHAKKQEGLRRSQQDMLTICSLCLA